MIALGPARRIAGFDVRVIEQTDTGAHRLCSSMAGWGAKRPLAVILDDGVTRTAWTPHGRPIPWAEILRRYPGVIGPADQA